MSDQTTDVVIVGAGPTGLSLACQLARWGVDFVIVDKNEGVTPYSKAIGVQARTLEIYEQLGIAERAVAEGTRAEGARLLVNGEVRGELVLGDLGAGLSPYPFVLMLEQSKNERLLYERLRQFGHDVGWNHSMESVSQSDAGATVVIRAPDGAARTIRATYLVGCDGARSPVRHALGIPFEGSTFERTFYVADARIDWDLSHDVFHAALGADTFVLFFPLKGDRRYRIVGVFPPGYDGKEGETVYAEIERRVLGETKLAMHIHDVEWFSTYKVHTRHARRFRDGRCFLAGDAAHIHSPAGAQGMNTGIQDAYNLGWKLALVLRGAASSALLDTYDEERLANAKHLLQTTDRLFSLIASPETILSFLRLHVMPTIAPYLLRLDVVRSFVFPLLSQIGIRYESSALSDHRGDAPFRVKAGERMPWFMSGDESVYAALNAPAFHWLVFTNNGGDADADADGWRSADGRRGARGGDPVPPDADPRIPLVVRRVPLDATVRRVFGTDRPFGVLLRPDNYIGAIVPETEAAESARYLRDRIGRGSHAG